MMKKIITKGFVSQIIATKWLILIILSSLLSGCGIFSPDPTLRLEVNVTPNTNSGRILTVVIVPMSKATFVDTDYQTAMSYIAKPLTRFFSLTPNDYAEGEAKLVVPAKIGQGLAVFVFFSEVHNQSQWKQYIANPYGNEFTMTLGKHSITRFEEE